MFGVNVYELPNSSRFFLDDINDIGLPIADIFPHTV